MELFLWRLILQDILATETIMMYNNSELSQQGYNIIEKVRQHRIISFNGIKLIVQEYLYTVKIFAKTD